MAGVPGIGSIFSRAGLVKAAAIAVGIWAFAQWGARIPSIRGKN